MNPNLKYAQMVKGKNEGSRPAVLVAEPAGDRLDVHPGFDATGGEQVPQIMMREL